MTNKEKAIVYLKSEEKEQVKQLAQDEGISVSYFIARLVREDLKINESK